MFNNLHFDKDGLIPCVVQDIETSEVLMLAYMNEESLKLTLETGETWFWSRTDEKLWHKGATSGNFQKVREIFKNCEDNSLLVKVEQVGVACHTGNKSCFYRSSIASESCLENAKTIPITIGMPAGSLEQGAGELMERAGLPIKWQGYRGFVDDPRIKSVFQLRPQDSPLYVARGNLDIAFTGQDCVQERDLGRQVIEIAQLPFARAGNSTVQFILFVREDSEVHDLDDIRKGMRIVTECPIHIIKQYLQKYGIEENVEIDICHGRTEAIVNAGFADIGIDRAETGKTLLENQLRPVATIDESVTILIVNPQSWADAQKRKTIDEIRTLLLGVVIAKDKVVLEMNVPAEKLEEIVNILPALRSPTISELYGGGWFAVKSVVEKRKVNLLIPELKALGVEGIIEGPLNKIIP